MFSGLSTSASGNGGSIAPAPSLGNSSSAPATSFGFPASAPIETTTTTTSFFPPVSSVPQAGPFGFTLPSTLPPGLLPSPMAPTPPIEPVQQAPAAPVFQAPRPVAVLELRENEAFTPPPPPAYEEVDAVSLNASAVGNLFR